MEHCPKCQANVEGLTHHCDCCGALLNEPPLFFMWHAFTTQASGNISDALKKIFRCLDQIDVSQYANDIQKIAFAVYCYPEEILSDVNIKSKVYYSPKKKLAMVNTLIDYNTYIYENRNMQITLVSQTIIASMRDLQKRMHRYRIDISKLLLDIEKVLTNLE